MLVPVWPGKADDVAGLDRLVHQQHEAADEVAGDGLQAEAQAEADGAGQHVEGGDIDAGGLMPSMMPMLTSRK